LCCGDDEGGAAARTNNKTGEWIVSYGNGNGRGMRLYCGNLAYSLSERELRERFERFGVVSDCKIIIDHMTNQSKGFGFVTMEDPEAACMAIDSLNEAELNGRKIRVNEARPRT
jgi:RNA recognition motif-containing protein